MKIKHKNGFFNDESGGKDKEYYLSYTEHPYSLYSVNVKDNTIRKELKLYTEDFIKNALASGVWVEYEDNNLVTGYSTNDEDFNHEHPGEVFDELLSENDVKDVIGRTYYSHEFKKVDLSKYLYVNSILDDADCYLYDDVRNDDEAPFSDSPQEAKDELKLMLKSWCEKWLSTHNCYEPVGKSTEHVITKEDLEDWVLVYD